MAQRRSNQAQTSRRELFEVRNGMGGLFDVSVIENLEAGRVKVQVHNPDFSSLTFTPLASDLRPTGKFVNVRSAA